MWNGKKFFWAEMKQKIGKTNVSKGGRSYNFKEVSEGQSWEVVLGTEPWWSWESTMPCRCLWQASVSYLCIVISCNPFIISILVTSHTDHCVFSSDLYMYSWLQWPLGLVVIFSSFSLSVCYLISLYIPWLTIITTL
jgi:hypothetical protein